MGGRAFLRLAHLELWRRATRRAATPHAPPRWAGGGSAGWREPTIASESKTAKPLSRSSGGDQASRPIATHQNRSCDISMASRFAGVTRENKADIGERWPARRRRRNERGRGGIQQRRASALDYILPAQPSACRGLRGFKCAGVAALATTSHRPAAPIALAAK